MSPLPLIALVASIALMYVIGVRIFRSVLFGLLNSSIFAATPLLWSQSRNAPASIYALPIIVAWLLAAGQESRVSWWAMAGGLLGVGVYLSYASAIMMLVYVVVTLVMVGATRAVPNRQLVVFVVVFALTASPLALYLAWHPANFRAAVMASRLYDANRFNVLQGIREMTSWVGLTARSEVYYDYFDPAFLFLTGRVLLLPLLVLIPFGLYRIVAYESALVARLAVAGYLAAPFAAALTAEAPIPRRILFITPFAAILASYGLQQLVSWRKPRPDADRPEPKAES